MVFSAAHSNELCLGQVSSGDKRNEQDESVSFGRVLLAIVIGGKKYKEGAHEKGILSTNRFHQ